MTKILLVLGGAWHDFDGFATTMVPVLSHAGYDVETTYDATVLERLDSVRPDVVMLYTVLGGAFDGTRTGKDFSPAQVAALTAWVARGNALVGLHGATVSEKTNAAYHALLGGHFESHPPQLEFTICPRHAVHPIIDGVNAFTVHDELYMHDVVLDGEIIATTTHQGRMHPMLWTRRQGSGTVTYFAPGHDAKAWNVPEFRAIVLRCVEWALTARSGR